MSDLFQLATRFCPFVNPESAPRRAFRRRQPERSHGLWPRQAEKAPATPPRDLAGVMDGEKYGILLALRAPSGHRLERGIHFCVLLHGDQIWPWTP